ncbi:MAG: hypothetical protein KA020_07690 [Planctomycetes bacterium]|jgi:hypothetical protein|nr:hypothetical protein [Planctomycetota bacterium]MCC7062875.1 hypothetical protein [Planctomycetota bacterium]
MASSPASPEAAAYRLGELTACWDQAYEALTQGDLERVTSLLDIAEEHLAGLPHASNDDPTMASQRQQAMAARGRLEHAMRVGLEGLGHELSRVRQGSKMLQGYRDPTRGLGVRFERNV